MLPEKTLDAARPLKFHNICLPFKVVHVVKIWHGDEYNRRGEEQLAGYLDYYKQDKGWLLSFNFNKNKNVGVKTIDCCGKTIVEAVV